MAEAVPPRGRFGPYGGQFVPETLMPALHELEAAYADATADGALQIAAGVGEVEGLARRPASRAPCVS